MLMKAILMTGFCLLFAAQGCMWSRVKINDESLPTRLAKVGKGMSLEDVITLARCQPSAILPSKEGRILIYNTGDTKTEGLMLILVNVMKTNMSLNSTYFFLDSEDRVTRVLRSGGQEPEWEFWAFD